MKSACGIYKEAIEMAVAEENLQHALPNLYVHFSHLKYMSTNNMDATRDILVDGIKNLPQNKQLLELEKAKKKEVAFIVTFAKQEQEIAELKIGYSKVDILCSESGK
ncbi:hypothetical protein HN51_040290 [Arachis hypogaea]